MPLTPATSPRFGARRPANTDDFNIERDVTGPIDALDLAAKFTSSLSTARPSSPVADQYNYSTDTNVLERWNGSAWVRPEPKPHASSHQDGGTDALTVREAMNATGALGDAKGSFSAYRNAALSLTNGGVVLFDTEEPSGDLSGWYDPATGRFTPQVPGRYRFSWLVSANAVLTADVFWIATLRKNGGNHKSAPTGYQRGTSPVNSGASASAVANGTTDFFDVIINHSVGAAAAISPVINTTYFQGELVGRL